MNSTIAVSRTLTIAASIERVWQAITTPAEIADWLGMEAVIIDDLAVGGRMRFVVEDGGDVAIFTTVEPPTHLAYHWTPEAGIPILTLVTFRLEATEGGTHITVTEAGFEALPSDLGTTVSTRNGKGWGMALDGIAKLVQGTDDE
jgi:uncharacterized protein YndB with AHSA1/START domain